MVSVPGPGDRDVFLNHCLLEGDSDLEKRAGLLKRRAILVSIVLQILIVFALVLIPLLGKSEDITRRVLIDPRVPYSASGHVHHDVHRTTVRQNHRISEYFQPRAIPTFIITRDRTSSQQTTDDVVDDSDIARYTPGDGNDMRSVPFANSTNGPRPPDDRSTSVKPTTVRRSEGVQMAMLIHRVEPAYPILCVQTRREGRVELHAIISTDGSIQYLEVVSGDPFFVQSALAAVRQWRYRPTILNGQPVEVDTLITVIYTLSH